jgi:alpha-beta hydrolase superfamily lysophospholipase
MNERRNLMPESTKITAAVEKFAQHYADVQGLGPVETIVAENFKLETRDPEDNKVIKQRYSIMSKNLRENNYPMIFSHGEKTADVIVLTHGLTDSPYYMHAIGERFYDKGLNVVLPLLPAHGLEKPCTALEDIELEEKWKKEIDDAAEVALLLGDRVSLGGFSTGGALSLNKILRDPGLIKGGLFLFSAAIDLGRRDEPFGNKIISNCAQFLFKIFEKEGVGIGPNPFKYPVLLDSTGIDLCQVIQENERLLKNNPKISHPVFAAHSVHDETVRIEGIIELLKNHVEKGMAFIISQRVRHEEVVLKNGITFDKSAKFREYLEKFKADAGKEEPSPNPVFEWMMNDAILFFEKNILP